MPLAASPLQLTPAEHRPLGAVATSGDGYVPGVCNIGPEEIRRRRASSMVAFGVAAAGLAMLIALGAPHPVRLVLLLPLWGGTFSWLQARRRFCGGFAVARISNFGPEESTRRRVEDDGAHRADMRALGRMTRDSFLLALPVTIALVLLPL